MVDQSNMAVKHTINRRRDMREVKFPTPQELREKAPDVPTEEEMAKARKEIVSTLRVSFSGANPLRKEVRILTANGWLKESMFPQLTVELLAAGWSVKVVAVIRGPSYLLIKPVPTRGV